MIHECNLNCHTIDPSKADLMGIDDEGKWMPFIFDVDIVDAAKLTSDDVSSPLHNCTTIFTKGGDAYIIDTPYEKFFAIFKEYHFTETSDSDNDLDL